MLMMHSFIPPSCMFICRRLQRGRPGRATHLRQTSSRLTRARRAASGLGDQPVAGRWMAAPMAAQWEQALVSQPARRHPRRFFAEKKKGTEVCCSHPWPHTRCVAAAVAEISVKGPQAQLALLQRPLMRLLPTSIYGKMGAGGHIMVQY